MKIVISDKINFPDDTEERLRKIPGIKVYDEASLTKEETIERIKDADIATSWYVDIDRDICTERISRIYKRSINFFVNK